MYTKNMYKQKQGYTVVAIVLVVTIISVALAVGIFVLPAMWLSQRDDIRKNNVAKVTSAIKAYQDNGGKGALPTTGNYEHFTIKAARETKSSPNTWRRFVNDYIGEDLADPAKVDFAYDIYIIKCLESNGAEVPTGQLCKSFENDSEFDFYENINNNESPSFDPKNPSLYIVAGATCNGAAAIRTTNARSAAVIQVLENGSKYCQSV